MIRSFLTFLIGPSERDMLLVQQARQIARLEDQLRRERLKSIGAHSFTGTRPRDAGANG